MNLSQSTALLTILMLGSLATTVRAQSLLVNFQADEYTGGSTWTDQEGNVTADLYIPGSTPVANGGSVTTDGGFYFSTGNVAGLDGLSNYTLAVGFTATGISSGGGNGAAYAGSGVMGGDISGSGAGDMGLSVSQYNNGIVAGGGVQGGSDVNVYDPASPTGTFSLNSPTGAVIVVQSSTAGQGNPANGSISLYVNGALVSQQTGLNTQPLGESTGNFPSVGSYNFGVGTLYAGAGGPFTGDITQEQIYSGALTASQAETLSDTISEESIPEPRTWALLFAGILPFALGYRRRRA